MADRADEHSIFCKTHELHALNFASAKITKATVYGHLLNAELLARLFPRLEKLEITETDQKGLADLVEGLPNLNSLVLRSCTTLTRIEIEEFAARASNDLYFEASLASETRFYDT